MITIKRRHVVVKETLSQPNQDEKKLGSINRSIEWLEFLKKKDIVVQTSLPWRSFPTAALISAISIT
jgi:hypothetical protein